MDYRIQPGNHAATTNQRPVATEKTGRNNHRGLQGASFAGTRQPVAPGSAVAVRSNFQAFLNEETALLAAPNASNQPPSGPPATPAPEQNVPAPKLTLHHLQVCETIGGWSSESCPDDPGRISAGRETALPSEELTGAGRIPEEVVAGWYGKYHQGRRMANGQRFNMYGATIAHRDMPIGTKVELENPKTGEKAKAVVTDRGPYHEGRDVDLSYALAKRLSLAKPGVGNLKLRVL